MENVVSRWSSLTRSFKSSLAAFALALWVSAFCSAASYNVTDLGTLGGNFSIGSGINGSGHVTGYAGLSSGLADAFLYDGTMHDLGTLGGTGSGGSGINASGQVTGGAQTTGDAAVHAFLYDIVHGMVDLNSLINPSSGWVLDSGNAINDLGQITGNGAIGGQTHAFLLTPVPEPSSLVLASLALGAIAAYRGWRRRRRA
jgi:probable HAF family extracellular repeat protein